MQMSRDYIQRARRLLVDANACMNRQDYALCVLRSAEAVEFSLKAALHAINKVPSPNHEVSSDLADEQDGFPEWFRVRLPRYMMLSKLFTHVSLPAKYGDTKIAAPPSIIFDAPEAGALLNIATDVFLFCERLAQGER